MAKPGGAAEVGKSLARRRRGPISPGLSFRYRLFRRMMLFLGWFLFGFEVHGAEKVPGSGPLILAANHRRYADPVLVSMAVPRRVQWMAKKEVFSPPLDRLFYFIGSFPVDREGGGRGALRTSLELLREGWALGIFPEGTRRKKGGSDPEGSKGGAAMLAARSGAAVLPVYISRVPNPVERLLRGGRLRVRVGDPMRFEGATTREARKGISDEVLRAVYELGAKEEEEEKGGEKYRRRRGKTRAS